MKYWSLNLLEPSGPHGTTLPFFTSNDKNKQAHHQKKKRMTLTTHSLSFFHIPHNDVVVVMTTQRYEIFTITAEGYGLNTDLVGIIFRHKLTSVEVPQYDRCLEHTTFYSLHWWPPENCQFKKV
jgi:hypothetical protein